ncbi:MAG: hypothetical protein IT348_10390 [Candidatus Eisenbacteria bacterium]|nr:hypothetical protein [Candidatus Eisenbacteria bacterium]
MVSENKYPFMTKAEVRRRLETEAAFVLACLAMMQSRHELRASGAKTDGPRGWMSSQRSKGTALAKKAAAGELTAKDAGEAARLLSGYAKQIAAALRERALASDPSLADAARVFGVLPGCLGAKRQPRPATSPPAAAEPATAEPAAEGPDEHRADGEPEGGEHDDELELRGLVLSHLSTVPAARSEEIARATGVTTATLSPVLRELVNSGRLRSTGVGRGTRYTIRRAAGRV